MGRWIPLSTRVITTMLIVGAAFVWGRAGGWCVGWQVTFVVVALTVIGMLTIREVNRAQVKDRMMLAKIDALKADLKESTRASIEESLKPVREEQQRARRALQEGLRTLQSLAERNLEASDPSYERPKRVHLKASLRAGSPTMRARLRVIQPTRRKRLQLRLMYVIRWIWGTHDA